MSDIKDEQQQFRWHELDKSMQFLFLFVFSLVQVVVYQLIIFYNLLDDVYYSLGIAIIIVGVTMSLIIRRIYKNEN